MIVEELLDLTQLAPNEVRAVRLPDNFASPEAPPLADRYLLAAGVLHGRDILELEPNQIEECLAVNMVNTVKFAESILRVQPTARVGIVSSLSGPNGSFDQLYAMSKAAINAYVATRKVSREQQLIAWLPTIIADAGMTTRRPDFPALLQIRSYHTSRQVAQQIYDDLWCEPWRNGLQMIPTLAGSPC